MGFATRIDGVLQEVPVPPQIKRFQPTIVSRIKILSHLNIVEKRVPQDGRIKVMIHYSEIDIRDRDLRSSLITRSRPAPDLTSYPVSSPQGSASHLEFYTTTAPVGHGFAGSEIQRVAYYLAPSDATPRRAGPIPPARPLSARGSDLVHATSRNFLARFETEPEPQPLLTGIQSLHISFYDGQSWQDSVLNTRAQSDASANVTEFQTRFSNRTP